MEVAIPGTVDELVELWWKQHPKMIPHESGGTVRMKRGGMHPRKIMEVLDVQPLVLVAMLQRDIDFENAAYHSGRPIHTPTMRGIK